MLGWLGPCNYYADMGQLSAVLRSWEDRFGAYVVAVGFDVLELGVERPPQTITDAEAVAAEHFAVCSDSVYQGAESIRSLAKSIVGKTTWSFWWD